MLINDVTSVSSANVANLSISKTSNDQYAVNWDGAYSSAQYKLMEGVVSHDVYGNAIGTEYTIVQSGGLSYPVSDQSVGQYRYKLVKQLMIMGVDMVVPAHLIVDQADDLWVLEPPVIDPQTMGGEGLTDLGAGPNPFDKEYKSRSPNYRLSVPFTGVDTRMLVLERQDLGGFWNRQIHTRYNIVGRTYEWDFIDQNEGMIGYRARVTDSVCEQAYIADKILNDLLNIDSPCIDTTLDVHALVDVDIQEQSIQIQGSTLSWQANDDANHYVVEEHNGSGWVQVYADANTSYGGATLGNNYRVKSCATDSGAACTNFSYVSGAFPAPDPAPKPSVVGYGDDTIGTLEGNFNVNKSGAATYSIPIMAPAGTAGVAPEISLNYSSQAGNGIAGKGWSIGGGSAIFRCRQTLQIDGKVKPISWSDADRFCFNGQRLLVNDGQTYGAVGATYRTEIDRFIEVTSVGGSLGHPDHFVVIGKDGSQSTFGANSGVNHSKLDIGNNPTSDPKVLTWAISEFKDSIGNPIKYTYLNDDQGFVLDKIYYAFGSNQSSNTSNTHFEFIYDEDRSDPRHSYVSGFRVSNKRLLTKIVSRTDADGSSEIFREYPITYNVATQSSSGDKNVEHRVSNVEECEKNGSCKTSTKFSFGDIYNSDYSDVNLLSDSIVLGGAQIAEKTFLDFDGDGLQDVLFRRLHANTQGIRQDYLLYYGYPDEVTGKVYYDAFAQDYFPKFTYLGAGAEPLIITTDPSDTDAIEYSPILPFKYNGDNKDDVLRWNQIGNEWELYVANAKITTGTVKVPYFEYEEANITLPFTEKHAFLADVDGNGLADMVEVMDDTIRVNFLKRDPSALDTEVTPNIYNQVSFPVNLPAGDVMLHDETGRIFSANLSGSGQSGLYVVIEDVLGESRIAAISLDVQAATTSVVSVEENVSCCAIKSGDYNSDGLTDLIYEATPGNWKLAINKGDGTFQKINLSSMPSNDDFANAKFADFNHDGFQDFYWHDKTLDRLRVKYWSSSTSDYYDAVNLNDIALDDSDEYEYRDLDSSGTLEQVHWQDTTEYRFVISEFGGVHLPHDKLARIEDGIGMEIAVEYEPLSRTERHHYVRGLTTDPADEEAVLTAPEYYAEVNNPFSYLVGDVGLPDINHMMPVFNLYTPAYVVTRTERDSPAGGGLPRNVDLSAKSVFEYDYYKGRTQPGGRGFLGYESFERTELDTGMRSRTKFRQDFPFTGLPVSERVISPEGDIISEKTNSWNLMSFEQGHYDDAPSPSNSTYPHQWVELAVAEMITGTNGCAVLGSLQPYRSELLEKVYHNETTADVSDPDGLIFGAAMRTKLSRTTDVDKYGNVLQQVTEEFEGDESGVLVRRQTIDNEYTPESWTDAELAARFGRLSRADVLHHRPGQTDITRVAEFDYYAFSAGGLLKTEVLQPLPENPPAGELDVLSRQEVTTTYDYDAFGNKERVTQAALIPDNGAPSFYIVGPGDIGLPANNRYTRWEYDTLGRYIDKTYNSLGHLTEHIVSRNHYGAPTELINYDGIVIETDYTPFGQPYLSYQSTGLWEHTLYLSCDSNCPPGAAYGIKKRQAGGSESTEYFDNLRRSIQAETTAFDGSPNVSYTEYDIQGRVLRQSVSKFDYWAENQYDLFGRTLKITAPHQTNPITTNFSYNGLVTQTERVDSNASSATPGPQVTTQTENAIGEVIITEDALGGKVHNTYDAQGNITQTTTYVAATSGGTANPEVPTSVAVQVGYDSVGRKLWTDDPDKGYWEYTYNGFGELIEQIDAKGNVRYMNYDALGRMVIREDWRNQPGNPASLSLVRETHSIWCFDLNNWFGKLVKVIDNQSGYTRTYSYDSFGREIHSNYGFSYISAPYFESITYDHYGRLFQKFDGSVAIDGNNQGAQYAYNEYGYLETVSEANTVNGVNKHYFTIRDMTPRGQVSEVEWGNGAISYRQYDPARGTPERLTTHWEIFTGIQDLKVDFDDFGNLVSRINDGVGIRYDDPDPLNHTPKAFNETYDYDGLNRLTTTSLNSVASQAQTFDSYGNIKTKGDVGTYSYNQVESDCSIEAAIGGYTLPQLASGPHAITKVVRNLPGGDGSTEIYCYDNNGNLVLDTGPEATRYIEYSGFDKPVKIIKGDHQSEFAYGPNRERYLRIDANSVNASLSKTTYYLGSVERIVNNDGSVSVKRYIEGQILVEDSFVSVSATEPYQSSTKYLIKDYLDSTSLVLHDAGGSLMVAADTSFDAWGLRRKAESLASFTGYTELFSYMAIVNANTNRGFTGHEQLDETGLVHMNGRIYDPRLARFVQADPYVQSPAYTQAYNRYSYGVNHPLSVTDPTGYAYSNEVNEYVTYGNPYDPFDDFWNDPWGDIDWDEGLDPIIDLPDLNLDTQGASTLAGSLSLNFLGNDFSIFSAEQSSSGSLLFGISGDDQLIRLIVGATDSSATGGKFANGAHALSYRSLISNNDELLNMVLEEIQTGVFGAQKEQSILNQLSAGVSVEGTVVAPILSGGGGTLGLNLQYTDQDGLALYLYYPEDKPSGGLSGGVAIQGNIAIGEGGWKGNFINYDGNIGPASGGYFHSPGREWQGISFGLGFGAPLGGSETVTNYVPLLGAE